MSWDAIAAIGIVFLAVGLLFRQLRGEKQVCDKCAVVETHRRAVQSQSAPVVKKSVSALKLGQPRSP